ncbi:MAG TPA: hypothetical protein RMH99_18800 [Sandaracinaceae bacterium LLY-WYZ-13_1]|nr:hypothetical protein [Sandaracinaceae bacterium LLY-WYZ-13_1]
MQTRLTGGERGRAERAAAEYRRRFGDGSRAAAIDALLRAR